ncbi:hypothetical protein [Bradyrhizobium sp. CCBAU 25338]|uniref:hypothetical protein n=1 Tax=Bradyrhizobium sp. CCBAU 25338 TaxID=1641877 RepID=UPI00230433D3|nr:hypothetical protein [Bradyrhizobium sp. CCBAU 25338]
MSSGFDANAVLEILRAAGSVGLSTSVAIVLALQSPKLLQVILTFIRNIIKDFRTPPQPPTSRTRQNPLAEK